MNQSLVTIWWAVQDTPYRVTQPPACPEWKLVCPAAQPSPGSLGSLSFSPGDPEKFWQRWAGSGWAGVTSRPHGATEMGGKGMIIFSKPIIDHYMQKNKPPRNHIIEHTISFSEILNKASITNIKHSSPWGVRGMRRQF